MYLLQHKCPPHPNEWHKFVSQDPRLFSTLATLFKYINQLDLPPPSKKNPNTILITHLMLALLGQKPGQETVWIWAMAETHTPITTELPIGIDSMRFKAQMPDF